MKRSRLGRLIAVTLVSLAAPLISVPSTAAATPTWSSSFLPPVPGHSDPFGSISSMSCASAGYCAAAGSFQNGALGVQGLLFTEAHGKWTAGRPPLLPPGAKGPSNGEITSVSCASPGNCSAAGDYLDSVANSRGFVEDQVQGSWQRGIEVSVPADANPEGGVDLPGLACPSTGNCTAVGDYTDSAHNSQALVLSEASGSWGSGAGVTLPSNATTGDSSLSSVSCPSPGNCTAGGYYAGPSDDVQGLLVDESSGTWATGVQVALPPQAVKGWIQSVSCSSPGNCSAVGDYSDSSQQLHGFLLAEVSGSWSSALNVTLPSATATGSYLLSVSCGALMCVAGGNYSEPNLKQEGLLVSESGGVWAKGTEAPIPADDRQPGEPDWAGVSAVSCPSSGGCSAVGYYARCGCESTVIKQTATGWVAEDVPMPGRASFQSAEDGEAESLYCTGAGDCQIGGWYVGPSGDQQALVATESGGNLTSSVGVPSPGGESWYFSTRDLWCGGPTSYCVLVGDVRSPYYGPGDPVPYHPMALVMSSGQWQWVKPVTPAKSDSDVELMSVSCTSPNQCTAVGEYLDAARQLRGLVLVDRSGTWQKGNAVLPPAGASAASLSAVSCPSAGNCTAVGSDVTTSGRQQGLVLNETSGKWQVAHTLAVSGASEVSLDAISCRSPGNCTAVASYIDPSGTFTGVAFTESSGTWGRPATLRPPLGAQKGASAAVLFQVNAVACTSPGSCTAVGQYVDASGVERGLILAQSNGHWARGTKAPVPAGGTAATLNSISCSSGSMCTAVGSYEVSSFDVQGFALSLSSGSPPASPAPPPWSEPFEGSTLSSVSCTVARCVAAGSADELGRRYGALLST